MSLRIVFTLLACLTFCTAAIECRAEGRGAVLSDSILGIPDDLRNIAYYPVDHWDETRNGLILVGGLILIDKPLTRFYQMHIEKPLDGFSLPEPPTAGRGLAQVGGGADGWLVTGVAATYLGGLAFDDPLAQRTALMTTKAMGYSILVSHVMLKTITGRKRPISWSQGKKPDGIYTDNPYDFGNFSPPNIGAAQDGTAMPSFHFTMFFAAAKVYQEAYDNYWIPYSLMTIGLASNINGHKHWVSDMVAGALVGTAIGSAVSARHSEGKDSVVVLPVIDGDTLGVQFVKPF